MDVCEIDAWLLNIKCHFSKNHFLIRYIHYLNQHGTTGGGKLISASRWYGKQRVIRNPVSNSFSFIRLSVVHRLYGGSSTDQPSGDRGGDAKNPREFA